MTWQEMKLFLQFKKAFLISVVIKELSNFFNLSDKSDSCSYFLLVRKCKSLFLNFFSFYTCILNSVVINLSKIL